MKRDWKKIFNQFVFATLLFSLIYLSVRWYLAPAATEVVGIRVKGDYTLMITQCFLGIIAMLLPAQFEKRWHLHFPSTMIFLYVLFLYCAIYLGEVRSFYYKIENWDTILHTFSGGMIATIGFSVICLLNNSQKIPVDLSPAFVALFAFCFALTIGVFWEIYEYTFDGILGLNMQKFMLEDHTQLIGRMALEDTMMDLVVDSLGAAVTSLIGFISLKYKKGWIEKLFIYRSK
ncbi:MAG: hypothetical protein PUF50_06590 [Erysipelotrichaceae bacterium]|nr:hypothetical protein [Erysipelotrichaceae bacterium]